MGEMIHAGRYHINATDKFKDIVLSVRLMGENREPDVTMRNLIAQILIDRCALYPTKGKMTEKCDELYGATVDTKTSSYGNGHCFELRAKTLNNRYAPDEPFDGLLQFVRELFLYPLIDEKTLSEAKTNVLASILRQEDNPSHLSMMKACELGGSGTPLAVSSQGNKKFIDSVNIDELSAYYKKMLNDDQFDIFCVGDVHPDRVLNQLRRTFDFLNETNVTQTAYVSEVSPYQEGQTAKQIEQTSLTQLYATQTGFGHPRFSSSRLAIVMLGQLPSSLMFQEIREKRSLCYSIYASTIAFDGIMFVSTGISPENTDEVKRLIKVQIDTLKSGEFDDNLLKMAKDMMISSLKSLSDEAPAEINFFYQRLLAGKSTTMDTVLDEINQVTREQIIEAVNYWQPICSYAVTKEQQHGNHQ